MSEVLLIPETVNVLLSNQRIGRVGRCVHTQLKIKDSWADILSKTVHFSGFSGREIDLYPPVLVAGTSEQGKAANTMLTLAVTAKEGIVDIGLRRRLHRSGHVNGLLLEAVVPWEVAASYTFAGDIRTVLYDALTGEMVRKLSPGSLSFFSGELGGLPNGNHMTNPNVTYLRPVLHTAWWAKGLKPGSLYDPSEDLQVGIPYIPTKDLPICFTRDCRNRLLPEDLWARESGIRYTRFCRTCLPSGREPLQEQGFVYL